MKILHLSKTIHPSAGGVAAVMVNLAMMQARDGVSVVLASYDRDIEAIYHQYWKSGDSTDPAIEFVSIANEDLKTFLFQSQKSILRACISDCDLMHVHGVWETWLMFCAYAARRSNVPYVITPHGMLDPWSLSQKKTKKKIALKLGYKRFLDKAAFIHVLNEDEGNLLKPLNIRSSVRLVPNGVFLQDFDENSNTVDQSDKIRTCVNGDQYILFMSRIHYKKGIDLLIQGFNQVHEKDSNIHLVIAGPDYGEQSKLESLVDQLGLQDKVHFVGVLYGKAKIAALKHALCFCLTSRQEGFSIAILEALASKLPVVISGQCHFDEVRQRSAGFVVTLEAGEIADALNRIIENDKARRAMGISGYDIIKQKYTWDRIASEFLGLYEEVIT
jgi:glycosyltransferase involved in cell wall biosynthesis